MRDEDCNRKPDLIVISTQNPFVNENGSSVWRYTFGTQEEKPSKKLLVEAVYQAGESARLIFKSQPNRRFVISSASLGEFIVVMVFDRSGGVCSKLISARTSPEQYLKVVIGLVFLTPTQYGFDPTVTFDDDAGKTGRIHFKGQDYVFRDVLHVEGVIRGRGTVVYHVVHPDGDFVIKDSWVDISREESEADVLQALRNVPRVPRLIGHEIVHIDGQEDTTMRIRESLLSRSTDSLGTVTWTWRSPVHSKTELREHCRIATTPVGRPLLKFRSLKELLSSLRDSALSTFRDSLIAIVISNFIPVLLDVREEGLVHRDMSMSNLVIVDPKDIGPRAFNMRSGPEFPDAPPFGMPIDYEYATRVERDICNTVGQRTVHYVLRSHDLEILLYFSYSKGTLPFMALDLLDDKQSVQHAICHDLESMWYVLVWLCHTQAGPDGEVRLFEYEKTQIFRWNACEGKNSSPIEISDGKARLLRDPKGIEFRKKVLDFFHPYFDPIKETVEELRLLLFPVAVAQIFRDALDTMSQKPVDRKSKLQTVEPPSERPYRELVAQFVEVLEHGIAGLQTHEPVAVQSPVAGATRVPIVEQGSQKAQEGSDKAFVLRTALRPSKSKGLGSTRDPSITPGSQNLSAGQAPGSVHGGGSNISQMSDNTQSSSTSLFPMKAKRLIDVLQPEGAVFQAVTAEELEGSEYSEDEVDSENVTEGTISSVGSQNSKVQRDEGEWKKGHFVESIVPAGKTLMKSIRNLVPNDLENPFN